MSDFEKLMGELSQLSVNQDTIAKALPADDGNGDEKIQAAAEGGDADQGKKDDDDDKDKGGEGAPMTKSLGVVKLADGTEVEAEDGTELVKSLMARFDASDSNMTKAIGGMVDLFKKQGETIAAQGEMIKSLNDKIGALSNEGRGRKTVISVTEKQAAGEQMAKSESQGMTAQEFMAKSNAAFDAGKITGRDLTVIDVSLRQNVAIDPGLIAKVVG